MPGKKRAGLEQTLRADHQPLVPEDEVYTVGPTPDELEAVSDLIADAIFTTEDWLAFMSDSSIDARLAFDLGQRTGSAKGRGVRTFTFEERRRQALERPTE